MHITFTVLSRCVILSILGFLFTSVLLESLPGLGWRHINQSFISVIILSIGLPVTLQVVTHRQTDTAFYSL